MEKQKKKYLLLAVLIFVGCTILSISSPVHLSKDFVVNVNALSEKDGFEDTGNTRYLNTLASLTSSSDKIDAKISKQTKSTGYGRSFDIEEVNLKANIVSNIGAEDEYVEEIPQQTVKETKTAEKSSQTTEKTTTVKEVKYKKLENSNVIESFDTNAENVQYMGNFKLTAYCPCPQCCGKWSKNRAVDEEGYQIVGTASGARAYANHTIAVDPKLIPYGTTVIIERNGVYYEYTAEDCGGAIKNKKIDVYFDNHTDACNFGLRYGNVYIIKK